MSGLHIQQVVISGQTPGTTPAGVALMNLLFGDDGQDGAPGRVGVDGATGATGNQGAVGPGLFLMAQDGDDGPDGVPGRMGDAGGTGNQGAAGPALFMLAQEGDDGQDGLPGRTGDTGITGNQGSQGPALFMMNLDGEDGADGPPGRIGVDGARGADGASGASLFMMLLAQDDGEFQLPMTGGNAGGVLRGTYPNPTLGSGVVQFSHIQDINQNVLLGRNLGSAGPIQELNPDTPFLYLDIDSILHWNQTEDLPNNARVAVRKNSSGSVFIRRRLNLIEGSNVTLTVADDGVNEEVDITIAASGSGSAQGLALFMTAQDGDDGIDGYVPGPRGEQGATGETGATGQALGRIEKFQISITGKKSARSGVFIYEPDEHFSEDQIDAPVIVTQTGGVVVGRGEFDDLAEFDCITCAARIIDERKLKVSWNSRGLVRGTYNFVMMLAA